MAQVIQIKRRIPGTGAPATLAAGEPATSISAGGVADLFIGDGSAVRTLVSAARQVELAGAQTITGTKTIDIDHLKVEGGDADDLLSTDGDGNLEWVARTDVGMQSVHVSSPLSGNGSSGTPITLTPATTAQIETGTDNVHPVTPAGLRTQLGEDAADLDTTAKTVVPAINELNGDITTLAGQVDAMTGALHLVGTYDVVGDEITAAPGHNNLDGLPLPQAAAANEGFYVIATTAGLGHGNAPAVQIAIGDWLVSTGTAWIHVPLHHAAVTAANVAVSTINAQTWTNVQSALEGLYTLANDAAEREVDVDGVSIVGDGVATPLSVATVDGGTF